MDPASTVLCTGRMSFGAQSLPNGGSVAIADVDGDGVRDVISVGYTMMSIHRRNADGTFAAPMMFDSPGTYREAKVLDLDMDGHPEIAFPSSTVQLFWNDGSGSFTRASYPESGAIAFGDLGNDGLPEMLATTLTGIHVWQNTGAGFSGPTTYDFGLTQVIGIGAGDLNADGKADAVIRTGSGIHVALNSGTGTFTTAASYPMPIAAGNGYVTLDDVTGDGKLDVVVAIDDATYVKIAVLPNQGNGSLGQAIVSPTGYQRANDTQLVVGDVTGDGIKDVAVTVRAAVAVATGAGDGTFGMPIIVDVAGDRVAAGDIDQDGRVDLVTGVDNGPATVFVNDGTSALFTRRAVFHGSAMVVDTQLIDLDGDGRSELITGYSTGIGVRGHAADGTSTETPYTLATHEFHMAMLDANRDHRADVVTFGEVQGAILSNPGNGTLMNASTFTPPEFVKLVAVGDVDADGDLDAVTASHEDLATNPGLHRLVSRGDGTFDAPALITAGITTADALSLADLDRDGHVDILLDAVFESGGGGLWTLHGLANGTFAPPALTPMLHGFGAMFLRDLNGDGVDELLHVVRDGIEVLAVAPDGSLTLSSYQAGGGGSEAALADFNGDGKLDIVAYVSYEPSYGAAVNVSLGNGDGTFSPPMRFDALAQAMRSLAVGDANGDGIVDIAAGGFGGDTSILYGRCSN